MKTMAMLESSYTSYKLYRVHIATEGIELKHIVPIRVERILIQILVHTHFHLLYKVVGSLLLKMFHAV
jgi:hypothetical protein